VHRLRCRAPDVGDLSRSLLTRRLYSRRWFGLGPFSSEATQIDCEPVSFAGMLGVPRERVRLKQRTVMR
jgi:hypothetical protein